MTENKNVSQTRLQRFTQKCKGTFKPSIILFTGIHIATIVIAGVYFEKCPVEPDIPKYMLTLGILGVVTKLVTLFRDFLMKYVSVNPIISFIMTAELTALIIGSYYVYREFEPDYEPESGEKHCNKTLYLFSFIYITIIYCLILFCSLVVICFIIGIVVIDKYGRKDIDKEEV